MATGPAHDAALRHSLRAAWMPLDGRARPGSDTLLAWCLYSLDSIIISMRARGCRNKFVKFNVNLLILNSTLNFMFTKAKHSEFQLAGNLRPGGCLPLLGIACTGNP